MSIPTPERHLKDAEEGRPRWPVKKATRLWIGVGTTIAVLAVLGLTLGLSLGLDPPNSEEDDFDVGNAAALEDYTTATTATQTPLASDSPRPPTSTSTESKPEPAPTPNPTYFYGRTGSLVKTDDGTEFVYTNDLGGDWAYDTKNPYGASGRAQSWTPRVNETWTWGSDLMRGVNLGGWLVTERE